MKSVDETGEVAVRREPLALRVIDTAGNVAAVCAGLVCLIMAVHIGIDVFMRSVFRDPVDGTLDITTFVYMPIMVFFALAATERVRQHITVSLVRESMSGRWVHGHDLAAGILSSFAVGLLLYFAIIRTLHSVALGEATTGSVDVPVWPASIAMTVGLVIFLLQVAASVIRSWQNIRNSRVRTAALAQ